MTWFSFGSYFTENSSFGCGCLVVSVIFWFYTMLVALEIFISDVTWHKLLVFDIMKDICPEFFLHKKLQAGIPRQMRNFTAL